jgi:hypothetical protein
LKCNTVGELHKHAIRIQPRGEYDGEMRTNHILYNLFHLF